MTQSVLRVSAIGLSAAVFASLSSLPAAFADTSDAAPSPVASDAATPSLAEPAPTPGWAMAGPSSPSAEGMTSAQNVAAPSTGEPAPPPAASASATTPETIPAKPPLSEPAPTPGWAEAPPTGTAAAERLPARHYVHRSTRHYAWRDGHRAVAYDHNPVATAATGLAGGVADLGSLAGYPIYCFPNYGSCPVQWAHRF